MEGNILKVTEIILQDPSKYLTLDFMTFLLLKLMDTGRHKEVSKILLDPRISVTLYPDLWEVFIERKCR